MGILKRYAFTAALLSMLLGHGAVQAQTTTPPSPSPAEQPGRSGGLYFAPSNRNQPGQLEVTRTVTVSPTRDSIRVWAGLGTEVFYLPTLGAAVSVPVGQVGRMNLALRGTVDSILIPADGTAGLPVIGVDVLASSSAPGVKWYGGPSTATVLGFAWLLGGVAGLRNEFGHSNWGWYAEGRYRVLLAAGSGSSVEIPSAGLRLGVTYRF